MTLGSDTWIGHEETSRILPDRRTREAAGTSREVVSGISAYPVDECWVYTWPAGATDQQKPHKEDELYYVVRGRARMRAGSEDRDVSQGSVIFVAAEVEHRFYDIVEELVVLVFFAPAES